MHNLWSGTTEVNEGSVTFSTDPSLRRTVLVSNIPANIALTQVLDRVRGGKITNATFLETSKIKLENNRALGTNAVMVTFLGTDRAKAYVDHCKETAGIFFWSNKWQAPIKAKIDLVETPSRPIPFTLQRDIREHGLSRLLYIHDAPRSLSPEQVVAEIQRADGTISYPVKAGYDEDGIMGIHFKSIQDAAAAWQAVDRNWQAFQGMDKGFLLDPCGRPLSSLAEVMGSVGPDEGGSGKSGHDEDAGGGEEALVNPDEIELEEDEA